MPNNHLIIKNSSRHTVILALALILIVIATGFSSCSPARDDYMVYVIADDPADQGQLVFYDPLHDTHSPILPEWSIHDISISIKDRLAFSSSHEGKSEIYLLDYPFNGKSPTNITPNTIMDNQRLIGWSTDGLYLAYESTLRNEKTLIIWDGTVATAIYQHNYQIGEFSWSQDGRLVFTDFYTSTYPTPTDQDPSEIFIWNGTTIISLSQNPSGVDRYPAWNSDGQLAFLSEHNDVYDIFVWDGRSKVNDLPDIRSFANIAPDFTDYISIPEWTNSGSLTFVGAEPGEHAQIYEWNGQTVTNLSQNADLHNGGQRWRGDGYWAFTTWFSREQLIYVRDATNQTLLTTEGQYPPAWSESGLLMFCVPSRLGWGLAIWDGSEVVKIVHGYQIEAFWRNGAGVFCTSG